MTKPQPKRVICYVEWTVIDGEDGHSELLHKPTGSRMNITNWAESCWEVGVELHKHGSSVSISCDGKTEAGAIREFERTMRRLGKLSG